MSACVLLEERALDRSGGPAGGGAVRTPEVRLEAALHEPPQRGHGEVVARSDEENLQHLELELDQHLRAPQEFLQRDHGGERGGLEEPVEVVAEWRNDHP